MKSTIDVALIRIFVMTVVIPALTGACNHLFYYPDQNIYSDPVKSGIPLEEGFIKTPDGEALHYWNLAPKGDERGVVVHFHGNAQNMTSHAIYSAWLTEFGYRVITFDYRGYGRSSGSPSPEGLFIDGQAVLDFVCEKNYKKIIVLGQSLGGIVAMTVLSRGRPACACGLILESTFSSYRDIARDKLSNVFFLWPFQYPLSLLVSDAWAPNCESIHLPALIVHGDQDQVVPYKFGKEVLSSLGSQEKSFWTVEGGGHTAAFVPGAPFRNRLVKFLNDLGQSCIK